MYWAVTTLSTVGYGDLPPISDEERLYALIVMVQPSAWFACRAALICRHFCPTAEQLGTILSVLCCAVLMLSSQLINMGLTAYILGNITLITTQLDEEVLAYRLKVKEVEEYMYSKVGRGSWCQEGRLREEIREKSYAPLPTPLLALDHSGGGVCPPRERPCDVLMCNAGLATSSFVQGVTGDIRRDILKDLEMSRARGSENDDSLRHIAPYLRRSVLNSLYYEGLRGTSILKVRSLFSYQRPRGGNSFQCLRACVRGPA